jgi:UDP-N-acetylglucosamine--N-acetylmuramyl-(pentapeptide) pyrophosphoryl-undecaprenol N-acetylglucosamine transferase
VGHKGDSFDSLRARFGAFDFAAFINAGKFRRYHGQSFWTQLTDLRTMMLNIRDFFRLFTSTAASYRLLARMRPDVVFSKGGFVAVPVGVAAKIRGIPIVTHDSDAQPGLANRIIGRWAKIHATAMEPKFYDYPKATVRWVGIPIDERTKRVDAKTQASYKEQIGLPPTAVVLLISGGGLGSKSINDKMLAIAPKLLDNKKLNIIHITGEKSAGEVRQGYLQVLDDPLAKRVKVLGFTGEFYRYVGAADLIIGRAGATSLAEFAAAGKPCIIIPSPYLSGGHQLKNAYQLEAQKAIDVVDNDVSPEVLLKKVSELLEDEGKRRRLAERLAATAKSDAANELAAILLDVVAKNGSHGRIKIS